MDTTGTPSIMMTPDTQQPRDVVDGMDNEIDAEIILVGPMPEGSAGPSEAAMPVERESFEYNMKHEKRGIAVIFNNKNFSDPEVKSRKGTDTDRDNLRQCLEQFGFEVTVYNDPKARQIHDVIHELSTKKDHSKRDCFFLAVFSHGDKNLIHAYDETYKPETLWNSFRADKCPTLAGKPKIFLVQACRGDEVDSGTVMTRKSVATDSVNYTTAQNYTVPNQADFLITYSTCPGYLSWREEDGTWVIQAFTKILRIYGKERDLLSIMTIIAREVALNYESYVPDDPEMHGKRQVPYITSTLIRDIYFR